MKIVALSQLMQLAPYIAAIAFLVTGVCLASPPFFQKTGWISRDLKQPLSILAFSSGKEFASYRINPGAFAFYQRTREGDFVIMRSLEPEHY